MILPSLFLLAAVQDVRVDADFPGGNAVLESVDGAVVRFRPDLRDTQGDWFYWHVRVRGAAGRELACRFPKRDVVGVLGPAVSLDGGATWSWAGTASLRPDGFAIRVPEGAEDVRLCVSIPYLGHDLKRFLDRHAGSPNLRVETLCVTRKGRAVERLHVGRVDGAAPKKVLLTSRHHACEMIATRALEGLLEEALTDAWWKESVEILAVPFMDKDGVEDGDQGKNRRPRDHNRDYDGESVHPSTAAMRAFVPGWSDGKLRFAMDLHCPTLRGAWNETIYFVGSANEAQRAAIDRYARLLGETRSGPLGLSPKPVLPFGEAWNTSANTKLGMTFKRWAETLPGAPVSTTIEISYANADGKTVTAESARLFGRDLARALKAYLQSE